MDQDEPSQTYVCLTSALVRGEWSASRPGRFTPGERAPGAHWIEGLVNPWAGMDDMEEWKFLILQDCSVSTINNT
jgi:hypothetical protein